jgi:hypothetical protein
VNLLLSQVRDDPGATKELENDDTIWDIVYRSPKRLDDLKAMAGEYSDKEAEEKEKKYARVVSNSNDGFVFILWTP